MLVPYIKHITDIDFKLQINNIIKISSRVFGFLIVFSKNKSSLSSSIY